ncbi:MAG: DUF4390 domain-containing protein [Gammaproteobacteria bacterium]|nr:DUF4390 domain-containing protein [Gammaproteobacteria bacterium]
MTQIGAVFGRLRGAAVLMCIALLSTSLPAQERAPFIVERADFRLEDNMLLLDLLVDSELPNYIAIAIDQGFAVPIMFEVEIRAVKSYWFDDRVVSLKQQYLLHYQPMLNSFVVLDVNRSERHYFHSRKAAVESIEVVYNYPMLDINNLAPDKDYYARVRFGIDTDELPLPLKSSSLWDNNWDLKSEWYEWEVKSSES